MGSGFYYRQNKCKDGGEMKMIVEGVWEIRVDSNFVIRSHCSRRRVRVEEKSDTQIILDMFKMVTVQRFGCCARLRVERIMSKVNSIQS